MSEVGITNWKQIFITAIITLVVTMASGLILSKIQTRKPRLYYSTSETIPFSGENQVVGIYHVTIGNEGGKATKNVCCVVQMPKATIEQWKLSADLAIKYSYSLINDTLQLEFPIINPSEIIQLSILATASSTLPESPKVSIRSEEMIGIEKTLRASETILNIPYVEIVMVIMGVATASLTTFTVILRTSRIRHGRHTDDQREILAYVSGIHGLNNQMDYYLSRDSKVSYWSQSDRLATIAINSTNPEEVNKIKSLLKDLLIYASIEDKSRGIIYYNLARIEAAKGNLNEMREYIRKAREIIPKLLELRKKIDPVFEDLETEVDSS